MRPLPPYILSVVPRELIPGSRRTNPVFTFQTRTSLTSRPPPVGPRPGRRDGVPPRAGEDGRHGTARVRIVCARPDQIHARWCHRLVWRPDRRGLIHADPSAMSPAGRPTPDCPPGAVWQTGWSGGGERQVGTEPGSSPNRSGDGPACFGIWYWLKKKPVGSFHVLAGIV